LQLNLMRVASEDGRPCPDDLWHQYFAGSVN
jgi:hypothetical protein